MKKISSEFIKIDLKDETINLTNYDLHSVLYSNICFYFPLIQDLNEFKMNLKKALYSFPILNSKFDLNEINPNYNGDGIYLIEFQTELSYFHLKKQNYSPKLTETYFENDDLFEAQKIKIPLIIQIFHLKEGFILHFSFFHQLLDGYSIILFLQLLNQLCNGKKIQMKFKEIRKIINNKENHKIKMNNIMDFIIKLNLILKILFFPFIWLIQWILDFHLNKIEFNRKIIHFSSENLKKLKLDINLKEKCSTNDCLTALLCLIHCQIYQFQLGTKMKIGNVVNIRPNLNLNYHIGNCLSMPFSHFKIHSQLNLQELALKNREAIDLVPLTLNKSNIIEELMNPSSNIQIDYYKNKRNSYLTSSILKFNLSSLNFGFNTNPYYYIFNSAYTIIFYEAPNPYSGLFCSISIESKYSEQFIQHPLLKKYSTLIIN